eukprot:COSAG01_NODE_4258_length_5201_cov_4.634065_8_plen_87_part_00
MCGAFFAAPLLCCCHGCAGRAKALHGPPRAHTSVRGVTEDRAVDDAVRADKEGWASFNRYGHEVRNLKAKIEYHLRNMNTLIRTLD